MAQGDLQVVREAARLLQEQSRAGVPRTALVELAGRAPQNISIHAGEPLIAVVEPAGGGAPIFAALSRREREVAGHVAAGLTNAQISETLVIALSTVKDHVHNILAKTGLPNRGAVAAAWHQA